jgi:hypothetical protein
MSFLTTHAKISKPLGRPVQKTPGLPPRSPSPASKSLQASTTIQIDLQKQQDTDLNNATNLLTSHLHIQPPRPVQTTSFTTPDMRAICQFEQDFSPILAAIVRESHRSYNNKDRAYEREHSPIEEKAARIVATTTKTEDKQDSFIGLCLDMVPVDVKRNYGTNEWSRKTAHDTAASNPPDLDIIGGYGCHLDEVREQHLGEDFYVGQILDSILSRWERHEYLLTRSLESLKRMYPKGVPCFYRKGQLRTPKQITKILMFDVSRFRDDIAARATMATVLEAAFCIYFNTFQINRYDSSKALEFATENRPDYLPVVPWTGCNRAFPLRQDLQLNCWKKWELDVLRAFKVTASNRNKINVEVQKHLATLGSERTVPDIQKRRSILGLADTNGDIWKAESSRPAQEFWDLVKDDIAGQIDFDFTELSRGKQADLLHESLAQLGIEKGRAKCVSMLVELSFDYDRDGGKLWTATEVSLAATVRQRLLARDTGTPRSEMVKVLQKELLAINIHRSFKSLEGYYIREFA